MASEVKNVNSQPVSLKSQALEATKDTDKLGSAIQRLSHYGGAYLATLQMGNIIQELGDFESSLLRLRATLSAATDQMMSLQTQRELGATSAFNAKQTAKTQNYLAQAGFKVNEILSATPSVLQLAIAGNLDLAQAADIASNVLGGMNLSVSEFVRVNDVMAKTASSSNTNIQQLGEALSYAAPVASAAGLSLEETTAAIGKLSDAGIQSSRAGTAIIGLIRTLSKATPLAQEALANYGLSMEDVDVKSRGLAAVKKTLKRINRLITDTHTQRSPFEGLGKPEPLKENLSGFWSRRIDETNRLVYAVDANSITIIACR